MGLFSAIASYAFWSFETQESTSAGHNRVSLTNCIAAFIKSKLGGIPPLETLDPALPISISVTSEVHQAPCCQDTVETNDNTAAFSNNYLVLFFFLCGKMRLMVLTHPPSKEAKLKSAHYFSFRKLQQSHLEFEWRPEQCSPTNKQHHHQIQNPFAELGIASPVAVCPDSPWYSA